MQKRAPASRQAPVRDIRRAAGFYTVSTAAYRSTPYHKVGRDRRLHEGEAQLDHEPRPQQGHGPRARRPLLPPSARVQVQPQQARPARHPGHRAGAAPSRRLRALVLLPRPRRLQACDHARDPSRVLGAEDPPQQGAGRDRRPIASPGGVARRGSVGVPSKKPRSARTKPPDALRSVRLVRLRILLVVYDLSLIHI